MLHLVLVDLRFSKSSYVTAVLQCRDCDLHHFKVSVYANRSNKSLTDTNENVRCSTLRITRTLILGIMIGRRMLTTGSKMTDTKYMVPGESVRLWGTKIKTQSTYHLAGEPPQV